jgi:hypothetical protein
MPFKLVSGNRYVVVMIEHFSKWIELVPILEKTSNHTAAALRGVLCRYGAPAEVLTDQGKEFQGEFTELLTKLLIDHCLTSGTIRSQTDWRNEWCGQSRKHFGNTF